ncbi:AraC family transcriptional regulator [Kaistia algarum]|nr:AraC family transcriptional regulator [Kaistia algarum]
MLFVPLPFVVALLLAILFLALLRFGEGAGAGRPFLLLIGLCALQSVLIGLRWGYGFSALRFALPVLAASLPPLVYASFHRLIRPDPPAHRRDLLAATLPPLLVVVLFLTLPQLIDIALVLLFVFYAVALLRLGRSGPDGLGEARFEGVTPVHRALYVAAAALCLSALFDLAVFLNFEQMHGANVGAIVGNANFLGLLMIGLTAWIAGSSQAAPDGTPEIEPAALEPDANDDREVLASVEALMKQERLYCDENLNLSRLARRAGMPARRISAAVNRLAGMNVSQYVNGYRIEEACRLLRDTDVTVTAAMLEAGFQTKSNFNREFRRVTGLSPAAWRTKLRPFAA